MTKEAMIHQMREKGLKITPQRLAILDSLIEKQTLHPSARTIFHEAKKRIKGVSLSTVYYTLNELSTHGIIKTLEFDKMENRYEGILTDHINLICKQCHAIIDHPFSIKIDTKDIARKKKFWVTETRVEYYGYCQTCIQGRTRPTFQHKPRTR
jgi:Fe2+ or Zn2+ uptake regulation protein